jgi:hypothetical protein
MREFRGLKLVRNLEFSGSVLNVEASELSILKAKDVHHGLVLQPVRLILQRCAFQIADGLLDLHDTELSAVIFTACPKRSARCQRSRRDRRERT